MEKTNGLRIYHWQTWVPITINLSHIISNCLTLSAMKSLTFTLGTLLSTIIASRFSESNVYAVSFSYCMSQHAIVVLSFNLWHGQSLSTNPPYLFEHAYASPNPLHYLRGRPTFWNEYLVFILPCKTIVKHKFEILVFFERHENKHNAQSTLHKMFRFGHKVVTSQCDELVQLLMMVLEGDDFDLVGEALKDCLLKIV